MKRQIPGLSHSIAVGDHPSDGEYLVRIIRARYRWDKTKPYYVVAFEVIEPCEQRGLTFNARIYCSVKALWKLNWFLRDFGYDPELLGRDELEERALRGLMGIVRLAHKRFDGRHVLNLEAFAPSERWTDLSGAVVDRKDAA